MIARGFKPVGWVAAVAGAAIGCYMLSLNVASERAELVSLERKIIRAKQDIRTLQTELGTRGRMSQLEQWNAEVLALSAPTANQYLDNEVVLARFDKRAPTVEDRAADVQLASATTATPAARPAVAAADYAAAAAAAAKTPLEKKSLIQRASLVVGGSAPLKADKAAPAAAKPAAAKPDATKPAAAKPAAIKVADKPAAIKPVKTAEAVPAPAKPKAKKPSAISADLAREIGETAKSEKKAGGAGGR